MSNTYGTWLKAQREAAGLTQQQLADLALMTRSHISHIEAGRRMPSEEDARRLDMALGTGDVLATFRPRDDDRSVAEHFEGARKLEELATFICEFAVAYFPGILQTRRYADAVLGTAFPPYSDEERDEAVVSRLERAKILDRPTSPVVWVLLDEAVFRRVAGSAEIMAEQIMHVVHLAERGRIRVHVLPLGGPISTLHQSMVTLMQFADQPPVAYTEGTKVAKLHDSPYLVARIQSTYSLAMSDALSLSESLKALRAAAKEYGYRE
ncbi:Scr1 family TA system antitoxin-like transcriptional regulator [Streptomyces fimicarius]|uniref:helix-turn-helix domain-containing protein n=1 Tax=Streptomyces griseus TaxID=1911 RepID=UPI00225B8F6B|nr:helix-turn-helix transcriptional regulator [Streptomyces griseus]MCX4708963.1 helix-turn-helix transcriptional regulator [Streptomyces griseus]